METREALRVGAAIYNDGHHHAAHDAWEDRWLDLEDGTDDERLLHGLIQFTAAVYHAHERNWEGCTGLAASAGEYLDGLPATYQGVELEPIRAALAALATDPEVVERRRMPHISFEDEYPMLRDLDLEETAAAAIILAEELGYDTEPIETAGEYARQDLADGRDGSRFVTLLFDFVREDAHRGIVFQRLSQHVERRTAKEEDVEGLF
ncbi:DUF309 domain-containing protein [Halobacteria archaeon AArc-dxtr1]|nr:DUF309 domain-containing protein [Halobacteria archaeon AArc-dxtr1]